MNFARAEGESISHPPLHLFHSYFQFEMKTVFAKSRILKMKLEWKTWRMNIAFCVNPSANIPKDIKEDEKNKPKRIVYRFYKRSVSALLIFPVRNRDCFCKVFKVKNEIEIENLEDEHSLSVSTWRRSVWRVFAKNGRAYSTYRLLY